MSEIVDDGDAIHGATDFLASADALEGREGVADFFDGDSVVVRGGGGHGGIANVEIAGERNFKSLVEEVEARAGGRVDGVANLVCAIRGEADFDNGGGAIFCCVEAVGVVAVDKNHAFGGDDIEEAAEAGFDLVEVAVDVGMVELDVVYDDEFGEVVNEFGALVEEGGVVFVPFEDEIFRVTEIGALTEVRWNSADEVAGLKACGFEYPGEYRGGGGFSVRAGDNEIVSASEDEVFEGLGE